MITVYCQYCGKPFQTKACRLKNGRGKFCSKHCHAKFVFTGMKRPPRTKEHRKKLGVAHIGKIPWNKGKLIPIICETCGKVFEVWPTRAKKGARYCSHECSNEAKRHVIGTHHPLWSREQKICEWCGKAVWVKKCKLHEFRFCSRSCLGSYTARETALHKGPTSIEQILMGELDKQHIQYEIQYRIANWLVDIAIPKHRLAIEADGTYWHSDEKQKQKDANKDHWLKAHKWTILRFPEDRIINSPRDCIQEILNILEHRKNGTSAIRAFFDG